MSCMLTDHASKTVGLGHLIVRFPMCDMSLLMFIVLQYVNLWPEWRHTTSRYISAIQTCFSSILYQILVTGPSFEAFEHIDFESCVSTNLGATEREHNLTASLSQQGLVSEFWRHWAISVQKIRGLMYIIHSEIELISSARLHLYIFAWEKRALFIVKAYWKLA